MAFEEYGAEASPLRLMEQDASRLQLQAAQTRMTNVNAQKAEVEVERDKRYAAIMQQAIAQGKDRPQVSMAEQLEAAAQATLEGGMPQEAATLAGQAAMIRSREATQATARAQEQKAAFEARAKKMDAVTRLLGGVQDQETFDAANQTYKQLFGEDSPLMGQAYDPALVDRLRVATLSEAQKARLRIQEADQLSKDRNRQSAKDFRDSRLALLERTAELADRREDRITTNDGNRGDGKPTNSPKGSEVAQAERLVKKEFPKLPGAERAAAAFTIASRAMALRRANKALDADEAIRQAFEEAKQNQDFKTIEGLFVDSAVFERSGDNTRLTPTVPAAPKPLPGGWTVRIK